MSATVFLCFAIINSSEQEHEVKQQARAEIESK